MTGATVAYFVTVYAEPVFVAFYKIADTIFIIDKVTNSVYVKYTWSTVSNIPISLSTLQDISRYINAMLKRRQTQTDTNSHYIPPYNNNPCHI